MAKDYKDHASSPRTQRLIARLVIAVLLVTIAVLGYNYWALLTSHRDATTRLTLVKADLDSSLASKADLTKMLDSCKEELRLAGDERKQLKDSEATLTSQLKTIQEKQEALEKEKNSLKEKSDAEIAKCQENSKQEVSNCNTSCELKIQEAKKSAEEACQQQIVAFKDSAKVQVGNEVLKPPNENNVGGGQQNPLPAN